VLVVWVALVQTATACRAMETVTEHEDQKVVARARVAVARARVAVATAVEVARAVKEVGRSHKELLGH
jgi:hypothetical protein